MQFGPCAIIGLHDEVADRGDRMEALRLEHRLTRFFNTVKLGERKGAVDRARPKVG